MFCQAPGSEFSKKSLGGGKKGRQDGTDGMDPSRRCHSALTSVLCVNAEGERRGLPKGKGAQASCSDETQDKATSAFPHSKDYNLSLLVLIPLGK